MTTIKKMRNEKHLTQQDAAKTLGISLRSFITYENDESKVGTPKYRYIISELEKINPIDEEHGVLTIQDIGAVCKDILPDYHVEYCYLFGSYAKGIASGSSDVDLILSTQVTGLKLYEMVERLRVGLHKKVDVLDVKQLLNNPELLNEVLKDGIKIYG